MSFAEQRRALRVGVWDVYGCDVCFRRFFEPAADLFATVASIALTLGLTFVYWLFVVRPGHAPLRSALPVFLATVAVAALVLPPGQRDLIRYIRYLGIPFELAVIALVVIGIRRARRSLAAAGVELDVPERLQIVLGRSGIPRRVVGIMATEFSILYYALAAWRRPPFAPAHAHTFSYHRKSGVIALLYAVLAAAIIELAALELLLRQRHHVAANVFLVIDAFAVLWILGYARAVQLRPMLVVGETLLVRGGMQWSLDVPMAAIDTVAVGRISAPPKRTPGYVRATFGQPNALITLKCPLVATGPYGVTRTVTRVGFFVDDPNALSLALSPATA